MIGGQATEQGPTTEFEPTYLASPTSTSIRAVHLDKRPILQNESCKLRCNQQIKHQPEAPVTVVNH